VDNASQWKEVLQEAAISVVLLILLDSLRITKNRAWFDEYCDFGASLCAAIKLRAA